jgi:hypothetical protein
MLRKQVVTKRGTSLSCPIAIFGITGFQTSGSINRPRDFVCVTEMLGDCLIGY